MKKITLLLLLLSVSGFSQTYTTGVVTLDPDFTVEFVVDLGFGQPTVAMTLVGPDNVWLGIAPGAIQSPSTRMGMAGDDCLTYTSNGFEDRNMVGSKTMPNIDSSQDWIEISNDIQGGVRTYTAIRPLETGDAMDFVFPSTDVASFPILWAKGNSLIFGYHGSRGNTIATLSETTLSVDDFKGSLNAINIYPNPVSSTLNITGVSKVSNDLSIAIYNILGEKVYGSNLNQQNTQISVSNWSNGVYVIKIASTNNQSIIKRFIKI